MLVDGEPGTRQWFAFWLDDQTPGIFDTFDTAEDRGSHLNGAVPKALAEHNDWLSGAPVIKLVDVLAAKVDV